MSSSGFFTAYIDSVALANWVNNSHSVCLVSGQWIADLENHSTVGHIPPAAIIATAPLQNRQVDKGTLIADNVTFVGAAGSDPAALVIKDDTTGALVLLDCDVNGLNPGISSEDLDLHWNACGIAAL